MELAPLDILRHLRPAFGLLDLLDNLGFRTARLVIQDAGEVQDGGGEVHKSWPTPFAGGFAQQGLFQKRLEIGGQVTLKSSEAIC